MKLVRKKTQGKLNKEEIGFWGMMLIRQEGWKRTQWKSKGESSKRDKKEDEKNEILKNNRMKLKK